MNQLKRITRLAICHGLFLFWAYKWLEEGNQNYGNITIAAAWLVALAALVVDLPTSWISDTEKECETPEKMRALMTSLSDWIANLDAHVRMAICAFLVWYGAWFTAIAMLLHFCGRAKTIVAAKQWLKEHPVE